PGSAAEPEVDAAGGECLLHLGVAAQVGALDVETLLGEQALLDTDVERQERPGTSLCLPDANVVVGIGHSCPDDGAADRKHPHAVQQIALHPIPSSASASSVGGTSRPNALAVFRVASASPRRALGESITD